MREPSRIELIRQIDRLGRPWGLSHMVSMYGDVLVAEQMAAKINLGCGISVVEKCKRDVTSMSVSYPFSALLRNRVTTANRKNWLSKEIKHEREKKEHECKMEAIHHELEMDIRRADKGRIIICSR